MSWNSRSPLNDTVSERSAALRAQHEAEQRRALHTQENDDMPRTTTGIKRAKLRTDEAKTAVGSLNQKLDEALDEVRVAMQRERQQQEAERSHRASEAGRAPALDNPRGVRA